MLMRIEELLKSCSAKPAASIFKVEIEAAGPSETLIVIY
jgi:hypothetical protein